MDDQSATVAFLSRPESYGLHEGTGKSQLARGLAPLIGNSPGAVVLRSDVIRNRMFGVDDAVRLPAAAHNRQITAQVYAEMGDAAGMLLGAGHSVIADAVRGTAQ